MKIWIPKCGDEVKLDQEWTFTLEPEHRNADFCAAVSGKPRTGNRWSARGQYQNQQVTFAPGCHLVFDRIYIRQDSGEYTSVTFMIKDHPNFSFIGERFWVKLADANKIDATFLSEGNPVGGFAKARYKAEAKMSVDPAFKQEVEDRKKAKAELEAARSACAEEVQNNNAGPVAAHVDGIIREVVRHASSANVYSYGSSPQNVRHMLISGEVYSRRGGQNIWVIDSTRKDVKAGTTIRNIRVWLDGRKFGGFTVTSRGTEIYNIAPLV